MCPLSPERLGTCHMHTQEWQALDSNSDAVPFPRPVGEQAHPALGSSLLCRTLDRCLLSPHILGVSWGHWGASSFEVEGWSKRELYSHPPLPLSPLLCTYNRPRFEMPRDLFGLHKLSSLLCSGHLILFYQRNFSSASFWPIHTRSSYCSEGYPPIRTVC